MQTKLVSDAKTFKKLALAAKLSGVTVKDTYKAGGEIHTELSGRDIANFMQLGAYLGLKPAVTDEEVKAYDDQMAAKKKETKPATA